MRIIYQAAPLVNKESMLQRCVMKKGKKLIFVAFITRNGKRIYASQYGKKAWAIWVDK